VNCGDREKEKGAGASLCVNPRERDGESSRSSMGTRAEMGESTHPVKKFRHVDHTKEYKKLI